MKLGWVALRTVLLETDARVRDPTASASPESISASDGSARRHILDSYSAPSTCSLSPPPPPSSPSPPPFFCKLTSQMLQHSISPTDYSSYSPSRDSSQDSVKLESSDTPDLGPSISNQQSPFHIGSDIAFNYTLMSIQQWKDPMRSQLDSTHPFDSNNNPNRVKFDLPLMDSGTHGTQDDSYEDENVDPFGDSQSNASTSRSVGSSDKSGEKHIRRRSSKGEPKSHPRDPRWTVLDVFSFTKLVISVENSSASANGPVRISLAETVSPSMLVSPFLLLNGDPLCLPEAPECTFLGPSRKRGPPKGYIDAIEARLHQTEAVLGIILSLAGGLDGTRGDGDPGASSLIEDLCQVRASFSDQTSSPTYVNLASIIGSPRPLHPPSSRGDPVWLKVERQTVNLCAVETKTA